MRSTITTGTRRVRRAGTWPISCSPFRANAGTGVSRVGSTWAAWPTVVVIAVRVGRRGSLSDAMGTYAMKRGDTFKLPDIYAKTSTGVTINLTGAKVWFTVKRAHAQFDTAAVHRADTTDGSGHVTIADAASGRITAKMPAIATVGFADGKQGLVYDVQVKDSAGDIFTVDEGTITVTPDVTRATS